ncbi:GNAT family N-acetyltransferase [Thiorhodospira sibirica]|uniref:GNAT family N-acetyltransferase n=1 Tax=Thiorhodospira sibirica TaxID=154347 RepID=UPI00022C0B3A|nr:GNAT family protein [Thiorhodospira sibirica]
MDFAKKHHTPAVREARAEDATAIAELLTDPIERWWSFPEYAPASLQSPAWISEHCAQALLCYVADVDKHIVGFVSLSALEGERSGMLQHLMVAPTHRGQDIATQLVRTALDSSFSRHGLREVHVAIVGGNEPAMMLFAELGFLPYGTREINDPAGQPARLVFLRITRGQYRQE